MFGHVIVTCLDCLIFEGPIDTKLAMLDLQNGDVNQNSQIKLETYSSSLFQGYSGVRMIVSEETNTGRAVSPNVIQYPYITQKTKRTWRKSEREIHDSHCFCRLSMSLSGSV